MKSARALLPQFTVQKPDIPAALYLAKAFDVLTRDIFQNELQGNTLNLHYTLADPESFGIARYEPTLPIYSV
mgnify:CR=1 FL=1